MKDMYAHYCRYANKRKTIPLRPKTFARALKSLLRDEIESGSIIFKYTHSSLVLGVRLTCSDDADDKLDPLKTL